ncbi:uncharacterized protein LOC111382601 isoform X2 [Olea europaea var. sylvestris]|uniref:uncharacterized protein LOC111382601 isoform X2 n=1 Tax=Olea europaea var. sylvestris TaxID=158386 RepID=UPI000C1D2353|nr:uncharacterized protein LOC111382601 isoform X2 [Olea europaea var. sylvestris]
MLNSPARPWIYTQDLRSPNGMTVLVISLRRLALEEDRNQVLQGTLAIQKCFRGHHARRHFHELKGGVIKLQSFICGEISRRKHCALLKLNEHVAYGMPNKQRISQFVGGWRNSNLVTLGIRKGPMLLKGNQAGRFLTLSG